MFGWNHPDVTSGRVASAQTLSGTGAIRLVVDFLTKFKPGSIYLSNPSWGNHAQIFNFKGMDVRQYRYYDAKSKGLDFNGWIEDLRNATPGSAVLLHTCAHNPTGVDPTLAQWK